jgi:hypothetical protein
MDSAPSPSGLFPVTPAGEVGQQTEPDIICRVAGFSSNIASDDEELAGPGKSRTPAGERCGMRDLEGEARLGPQIRTARFPRHSVPGYLDH